MSHHQLRTEPPKARWPWVLGAIVAVIALVAAAVTITTSLGDEEATPPPISPPSTSAASSTSPSTEDGAGAAGCLGGVNPTKAVLTAQKEAKLDPKGAASFAATVMRWRTQYPSDPAYAGKAKQVMTPDAGSDLLTISPDSGGPEDSGWGTTKEARYRVTEATSSTATVEIIMPFFITSKEYPESVEVVTGARWRLVAADGKWKVADMDAVDPKKAPGSQIQARGLTFKGVC